MSRNFFAAEYFFYFYFTKPEVRVISHAEM